MPKTLGGSFVLKGSTDGTSATIKLNDYVQPYAGPFINAVVTNTGSSGTIKVTAVGNDNSITLDTAVTVAADTDLTFTVPVSAQESDDAATPLLYPFLSPPTAPA